MLDHQLQHDLVQVGPMIPAVAPRDVNDLGFGLLFTVITSIHMKAPTVEMGKAGCKAQTLGGGRRYQTVEFCHPVVIEGLQGTPQGVVIELFRGPRGAK
jgi:hypothetical protein